MHMKDNITEIISLTESFLRIFIEFIKSSKVNEDLCNTLILSISTLVLGLRNALLYEKKSDETDKQGKL